MNHSVQISLPRVHPKLRDAGTERSRLNSLTESECGCAWSPLTCAPRRPPGLPARVQCLGFWGAHVHQSSTWGDSVSNPGGHLQKVQATHFPPGLASPGQKVEKGSVSDILILQPGDPALPSPWALPPARAPLVLLCFPGPRGDAEIVRSWQSYRSQGAGGRVGALGRLQQVRTERQVFQQQRRLQGPERGAAAVPTSGAGVCRGARQECTEWALE